MADCGWEFQGFLEEAELEGGQIFETEHIDRNSMNFV